MNPIRMCLPSFSFSILILLIISFSSNNVIGQPLAKSCLNSAYDPLVDTGYAANLNSVLSSLSSNALAGNNASNNYEYYNLTAGVGVRDVVYGLYLCRGDVNKTDCATCVQTASKDILTECPNNKTAIVWYDNCMLRYSNQTGFPDDEWMLWNQQNSTDPQKFNEYVGNVMNDLATKASSDISGRKFAVQEGNFSAIQSIFSLAQCIPDLSSTDCDSCLRGAISQLPNCCNGKLGGRILGSNCNIRYETYRFYTVPPPPHPPALAPAHAPVLNFPIPPHPPAPATAPVLNFPIPPTASNVTVPSPPNSNSAERGVEHLFRYVFFIYVIIYFRMF